MCWLTHLPIMPSSARLTHLCPVLMQEGVRLNAANTRCEEVNTSDCVMFTAPWRVVNIKATFSTEAAV